MAMDILAFWYQVVIASEPLLREAIQLLDRDDATEFERDLRSYYARHLEEEKGHAEMALADLGGHPFSLHFGAAQIPGTAYYLINHVHPVALLGYMQALECYPIDPAFIAAVERDHGTQAARTLRLHADEDPKHAQELESFPVPDEWVSLVQDTRKQIRLLVESM